MFKKFLSYMTEPVITIELDQRYNNKLDLTNAVVRKMREEGKNCEFINKDIIILDGIKYHVKDKMVFVRVPVQQVVLKQIKS